MGIEALMGQSHSRSFLALSREGRNHTDVLSTGDDFKSEACRSTMV